MGSAQSAHMGSVPDVERQRFTNSMSSRTTNVMRNSAPNHTLSARPDYEDLLPPNLPFGTTSAQNSVPNLTLGHTPDNDNEVPAHIFFGTHKYNIGGALKAPIQKSQNPSSSKGFRKDN